jgi:Fe-S cluster assembly ATP-binding protein
VILDAVQLQVAPGEIHALLGVNGSGKSSLAYAVMGCADYQPDRGRIVFDGRDITGLPIPERARLGLTLAWQEPARFEGLLVGDYLTLARPDMTRGQLWAALSAVALAPEVYLPRPVDATLSGGERKRIELAAVFAMRARLAILDEPDSGVDVLSLDDIVRLVRRMADDGTTVLLITHRDEMATVATRASLLSAGRIVLTSNPAAARAELAASQSVGAAGVVTRLEGGGASDGT